MLIECSQKKLLTQRIESEPSQFIQVLYCPRQVGKTTLALQFMESTKLPVHFASADLVASGQSSWISQQWEAARIKLWQSEEKQAVLIIDEIQKIGNWSEAVKREWDGDTAQRQSLKVVLLGSSRLLLQQGLTESLAGRFETLIPPGYSVGWKRKALKWCGVERPSRNFRCITPLSSVHSSSTLFRRLPQILPSGDGGLSRQLVPAFSIIPAPTPLTCFTGERRTMRWILFWSTREK